MSCEKDIISTRWTHVSGLIDYLWARLTSHRSGRTTLPHTRGTSHAGSRYLLTVLSPRILSLLTTYSPHEWRELFCRYGISARVDGLPNADYRYNNTRLDLGLPVYIHYSCQVAHDKMISRWVILWIWNISKRRWFTQCRLSIQQLTPAPSIGVSLCYSVDMEYQQAVWDHGWRPLGRVIWWVPPLSTKNHHTHLPYTRCPHIGCEQLVERSSR